MKSLITILFVIHAGLLLGQQNDTLKVITDIAQIDKVYLDPELLEIIKQTNNDAFFGKSGSGDEVLFKREFILNQKLNFTHKPYGSTDAREYRAIYLITPVLHEISTPNPMGDYDFGGWVIGIPLSGSGMKIFSVYKINWKIDEL